MYLKAAEIIINHITHLLPSFSREQPEGTKQIMGLLNQVSIQLCLNDCQPCGTPEAEIEDPYYRRLPLVPPTI